MVVVVVAAVAVATAAAATAGREAPPSAARRPARHRESLTRDPRRSRGGGLVVSADAPLARRVQKPGAMSIPTRRLLRRLSDRALTPDLIGRIEQLPLADRGHGYDDFGTNRDWLAAGLAATRPLYERWFRVRSYGAHHIPAEGPAILAANHSGTLPYDGAMLFVDVVRNTSPPRLARPVADTFVPRLPFVSVFFARMGVVSGSRSNVRRLLRSGELLMIFPEGTPGIGKAFRDRYRLQEWREGHAELAIRHRVPVVPVAIIGAEEQMPQIGRLPIAAFGAPYLPIPATPIPLPVRYHIHYGAPIPLHEDWGPERSDDPEVVAGAALRVRDAVQALIDGGLAARQGVFA